MSVTDEANLIAALIRRVAALEQAVARQDPTFRNVTVNNLDVGNDLLVGGDATVNNDLAVNGTLTAAGHPVFPAGNSDTGITGVPAGWGVTITYCRQIAAGLLSLRGSANRTGAAISAGAADIALGTLTHPTGNLNVAQGLDIADTNIATGQYLPALTLNPSTMALTLTRYPDIATGNTIFFSGLILYRIS